MAMAIHIHDADNVVVLIENVKAGGTVTLNGKQDSYVAREDIAKGHKMAIAAIAEGEEVIKFGVPIGPVTANVSPGEWISQHNLLNDAVKRGEEARRRVREGQRQILVYPRADGRFGIRNYVMAISTSPDCNAAAEAISDATGCTWMCCDRTHLDEGRVSTYTRMALSATGCNPNIHSVLVLKADGEKRTADEVAQFIRKTGKPVSYLDVTAAGDDAVRQGVALIEGFQAEAAAQKREPRPIEGLTIAMQNSGSDWTTAILGNPVNARAMDLLVKDGGCVLWGGGGALLNGIEDLFAEKFAKRADALKMLDRVEHDREMTLKQTGKPIEYEQPNLVNIVEGITTLAEKGYYMLSTVGESPIQGFLQYCEQPPHNGFWNNVGIENGLPPCAGIFGSLQGAHLHMITTSAGYLYYEIPHTVGIRVTGNEDTFHTPEFRKDFNAGAALREGIPETGEKLYQLILDAAEGKVVTKTEENKQKVFHMWYYVPIAFYEGSDRSKTPPFYHAIKAAEKKFGEGFQGTGNNVLSQDYTEALKLYTDRVK
ncbi:MAG: altronate dehydratase family protein [Clostridiales bacterium]|nr:altronate dehydratase family protein [Clostridiales bacterium]